MEKKVVELKTLKEGSFVLFDGEPCKVNKIQKSKPGKHGGAKARLSATGIFTGAKKALVKPASTKMDVPIIEKRPSQVLSVVGDTAQLMDMEDYNTFDVKIPEDIKVEEGSEVTVWKYGSYVAIMK